MKKHELEALATRLEADADYRVLRRFRPRQRYRPPPDDPAVIRRGIYLDVETTGLDPDCDEIIELAMVPFDFAADGRIFEVHTAYDELNDPGRPLPEIVQRLTGLRDEDLAGRHIDADEVARQVADAAVVIAHNAAFDRRFVERRFPVFESKAWACSLQEVPWQDEGIESPKLEYIAYRFGWFYDGHRAAIDCMVGIHVLSQPLPDSGRAALAVMLDAARTTTFRLWATDSPFEAKDILKARGYRWNSGGDGQPRAWFIDLDEERFHTENEWLLREIYRRDVALHHRKITCFNRYSDRISP